jgi:hypothetical protein
MKLLGKSYCAVQLSKAIYSIASDSNTLFPPGSDQARWLEWR